MAQRYRDYSRLSKEVEDLCKQKGIFIKIPTRPSRLMALYVVVEHVDSDPYKESRSLSLEELKYKSIDLLEITIRASNCLKKAGIKTIRDLLDTTTEEILNIRHLGISSYYWIMVHMFLLGFEYKDGEWVKMFPNGY